ncbi:tRNA-dihydrouridine(47) synthase [NAD(P)(+)]-like isoform X2 [Scleropages formosus]|uniref:tRNA-dihydrouridine(47) synthase [NAD(P)(+)] n=2 Tax=Scleropages formosus TaxID=113540 RepID=A0A8C9VHH1_SCLFO|nr:tRNA-dihydrouridine(47) synthase [NAD(P)(+)]-like isoform X2 [Scleropages formosus]
MEETANNEPVKSLEVSSWDKGSAAIKQQYVTTKEKFHESIDSAWQKEGVQRCGGNGQSAQGDRKTQEEDAVEPPGKKIKLEEQTEDRKEKEDGKKARGQFKCRPHRKPHNYDIRLCPSVVQERADKCFYGDKCKFFHDIAEYMSVKPEDIGERCHLFDTFGRCQYSVTCRFAKAHTGEGFKNLVNEELLKKHEGRLMVKNALDKDLQRRLRKKQVSFKASEAYLKTINKTASQGASKKKAAECQALQCSNGDASTAGQDGQNCTAEDAATVDGLKAESVAEKQTSAEELSGSAGDCEKRTPHVEPTGLNSSEKTQDTQKPSPIKTVGALTDADLIKLRPSEKKQVDFRDKMYLAPLTTCGNLPFRRICKRFGADITCGEMAMCTNLLQGQSSEWALLKRHESEDLFGVQLEGCFPDTMTKCAELLNHNIEVDFVDINSGCPIDLVYKKGGGCGLMTRTHKFEQIVRGMNSVLDVPLTVKIRTGVQDKVNIAHKLIPEMKNWGVSMITLHGRSREQRYTKLADWEYIDNCSKLASPIPLFGNGDILSYEDAIKARETGVSGIMLGRGALIKPWIFTEIKEQRHWDISSNERMDILKDFTRFGLEHWGSDTQGLEKTRSFLLEWLSFLCRYIPVGLLEHVPQKINERPPYYMGRDYLETLMASQHVGDWIKISEMLLGPVPQNFSFLPKHKANAYK